MGCLCSKDKHGSDPGADNDKDKQNQLVNSVPVVAPSSRENNVIVAGRIDTSKREESVNTKSNGASSPVNVSIRGGGYISSGSVRAGKLSSGSVRGGNNISNNNNNNNNNNNPSGSLRVGNLEGSGKTRIVERPKDGHYKRSTTDMGTNGGKQMASRMISMPHGAKGEQAAAGWPAWLTSVAAEAIQGWVPRSAESFEKLHKIGQGTYSSVYKARDLTTNKIVAMKKVRFVNMDPDSVQFMAREICVLRKLDHPNVMKLEALVTSRISGSLYLVFEYMEHDLAGLTASPGVTFTEPQVKCYMQQMFRGLEHCHSRGILHRDIKGSNLLIDNNGVLKIGDFGLATFNQTEPLTSHVVTLWYRAPELLMGATEYGPAIDMWSTGCILAELFGGKPIMTGRTEVEQIHKIFKLCGSPSEEYWSKSKVPHATSFKPQQLYRRRMPDTFKDFPESAFALVETLLSFEPEKRGTATSALNSQFFITRPLPCDPSTLPKYPPSKELDAKLREEEARRQKEEIMKGGEAAQTNKKSKNSKGVVTPHGKAHGQGQPKSTSVKVIPQEDSGVGFPIEPRRGNKNGYNQSNSMIHPNAGWTKKVKEDEGHVIPGRTFSSSRQDRGLARQTSRTIDSIHVPNYDISSNKESMGYVVPKRNRILCSGPLVPTGGNMEDMLKEHERQMQEAVRKSRLDKNRSRLN